MKNNWCRFLIFIISLLFCGIFSACGGSGASNSSQSATEITDPELYVSGYIIPINFHSSAIGAYNYYGWVIIDDVSTGSNVPITDANVTINGQTASYSATYGEYISPVLGTFNVGSTFTVAISHPRITLTRTLTVPTATVPATFTFNPLFDNSASKTVQNTTYTITPTSAWSNYGCIISYLYGTSTTTIEAYGYYSSLATGAQFTPSNLSFGSPAVLSQNISFAAWNMDLINLEGFNAATTNRLRVWAPYGETISQNF